MARSAPPRGRRQFLPRAGVQVGHAQHEVGIGAELVAQLGAGGGRAVNGDRAVGDLDGTHAAVRVLRPQRDAVLQRQHVEAARDVAPQVLRRAALRDQPIAEGVGKRDQRGNRRSQDVCAS